MGIKRKQGDVAAWGGAQRVAWGGAHRVAWGGAQCGMGRSTQEGN